MIGSDGVTRIGGLDAFRDLRHLVIDGVQLGDPGADYLATVTRWPKLETLSLQHDQLTDAGLDALLRWPTLKHLRYLAIGTNEISAAAIERLVHTPGLRLERLELWQTPAAASARAIVDASPLAGMRIDETMVYDAPPWLACT